MGGGRHRGEKLFEQIISLENLLLAWQEFRRGKRAKADVAMFEMNLEEQLLALHRDLFRGVYLPAAYVAFNITDPKLRHIHKACVRDRVVPQAVFRVLYPIFEPSFIFDSYACRLDKGTHRAVARLELFCRRLSGNYRHNIFALKCDIRKFFATIDHSTLKGLIADKVGDDRTLWLVDLILESFAPSPGKGLPLGNVTSQLFANIYLNEFDHFVKGILRIKQYIRYTDDFIILNPQRVDLESLLPPIAHFLEHTLLLELHPKKVIFRKFSQGFDFLGYVVLPRHIVLRTKTKQRMFRKIKDRLRQYQLGQIDRKAFNQSLQSYFGMLKHCRSKRVKDQIKQMLEAKNSLIGSSLRE